MGNRYGCSPISPKFTLYLKRVYNGKFPDDIMVNVLIYTEAWYIIYYTLRYI